MINLIKPLGLVITLFPALVIATPAANIVGGTLGYGTQSFKSKSGSQADGGDSVIGDLYYRYMFNDYFGIDSGLLLGTGGVASAIFDSTINDVKNISYKGIRSALYAQYPVSAGNSLYVKLGANGHKVDYTLNKVDESESGIGFYGAAGWQYRFGSGIGINAEYQYIPMSNLEVKGISLGINYRF